MNYELQENERCHILYYGDDGEDPLVGFKSPYIEGSPSDDEYKEKHYEEKDYADWLNKQLGMYPRLVNVVRHPDMNRNILIHYFVEYVYE
jgi:hypothetical protein